MTAGAIFIVGSEQANQMALDLYHMAIIGLEIIRNYIYSGYFKANIAKLI